MLQDAGMRPGILPVLPVRNLDAGMLYRRSNRWSGALVAYSVNSHAKPQTPLSISAVNS